MESRTFIRIATELCSRIKETALASTADDPFEQGTVEQGIQKQINAAFVGLQNPTLPSAYKLRDVALDHGYYVDPRVQQRIAQAESAWGN